MTPPVAVVLTDWLADPLARRAGTKTVALVLALAARVALVQPAGEAVIVAADEWREHLDLADTDRAVSAGLVTPVQVGDRIVGFHVAAWALAHVDSEPAILTRWMIRERVRRSRARAAASRQLELWGGRPDLGVDAAQGESGKPLEDSNFHRSGGLWKTCGRTADVTALHPGGAPRDLIIARAEVRTSTDPGLQGRQAAKSVKQQKAGEAPAAARDGSTFALVLAVVAHARRSRWSWRFPTTSVHRRDLRDAVRRDLDRAHLTTPTDTEIRRAIRLDEKNDPWHRVATGTGGPTT